MSAELRFRLNETDVIFERFDEEIVAIQLATGAYHSVSGAGIDAFLLLPFDPTISEMAGALAEKYAASQEAIAADLGPFLERMGEESLVMAQERGRRAGKPLDLGHSGLRLPYAPPALQPFRDLQELFLIDPVHDVAPQGWPQVRSNPGDNQQCRYRPKSSANMIFERFDEETVAFNLGTGAYHSLSGPAEDIFLLLGEEPTSAEIALALRTKYDVPDQKISDGVAKFLHSLMLAGLIEREATAESPEGPLPTRQLALAKPGQGLAFVTPDLDTYRERAAPAGLLAETQGHSPIDFARKRFRIPEAGVAFKMAGLEAVVINVNKGEYYLLNSSSTTVFRLLQQQPTASELVDNLVRIYAADRREVTVAVLILLRNLIQEGLVAVEEAGATERRLEVDQSTHPYEPFSVKAFRELRGLFLPFPGTRNGRRPSGNARELASLLAEYHQEVATRAGLTEAVYQIAGQKVRVRCAGGIEVRELGLAFEHLANGLPPGSQADLTIQVWDGGSGGPPRHPFLASYLRDFYSHWETDCGPRGEVLAFHSEQLPVLYHAGPDILKVIDSENRTAYYFKRDQSPLPYWEIGSPFRAILHHWLSLRGLQFVHGAAVGDAEGGAILAGKGGSGKSTIALACLNAGMSYAGDDYCAVKTEGAPYLHSLYSTAKLKGPEDLDRFPHLRDRVWNRDCFAKNTGDKATFFLSQWWPDQMSNGFPLRAVLVPRITGQRDTELGECSEAQALLALSASTIAQLPMAGSRDLERLGNLVAQLPRYMLYAGTDLAQIPAVIRSVL